MTRPRRKRVVRVEERHGPTPETLAKLQQDPLQALLQGQDTALERAADEIRAIWSATTRFSALKNSSLFALDAGRPDFPAELAHYRHETFLPWTQRIGPNVYDAVIWIVWERKVLPSWAVAPVLRALTDYARMMGHRKTFEPDALYA